MDDLIERMAKAYYLAFYAQVSPNVEIIPWEELSQEDRDIEYDAMHAALKELREPTQDMIDAGSRACLNSSGDLKQTTARQHRAMIDKLLEVK